jgi:hypothetical protein
VPYTPLERNSSQKPAILPISPILKDDVRFLRRKRDEAPCYLRPILAITYESASQFLRTMTKAQSSLSLGRRVLIVDECFRQDASAIRKHDRWQFQARKCLLFRDVKCHCCSDYSQKFLSRFELVDLSWHQEP